MRRIPLNLGAGSGSNGAAPGQPAKRPLMGWAAVGFGLLGVFSSFVFVPIGLICSILALFMGQAMWGFFGILITIVGILTSPVLLGLIGLGTFAMMVDWQSWLQPIIDFFHGSGGNFGHGMNI